MRKRNEMVDDYFGKARKNKLKLESTQRENSLKDYTDMSLKYINSFLPHGAIDLANRKKKIYKDYPLTITPKIDKEKGVNISIEHSDNDQTYIKESDL